MTQKPKPRIHDDPSVREQFFGKFIGATAAPTGLHIVLGSARNVPDLTRHRTHTNCPEVYVTGRIVISPEAAIEMAHVLNTVLQAMSKPQGPAN